MGAEQGRTPATPDGTIVIIDEGLHDGSSGVAPNVALGGTARVFELRRPAVPTPGFDVERHTAVLTDIARSQGTRLAALVRKHAHGDHRLQRHLTTLSTDKPATPLEGQSPGRAA